MRTKIEWVTFNASLNPHRSACDRYQACSFNLVLQALKRPTRGILHRIAVIGQYSYDLLRSFGCWCFAAKYHAVSNAAAFARRLPLRNFTADRAVEHPPQCEVFRKVLIVMFDSGGHE